MPIFAVLCLLKPFTSAEIIIDWHNYGFTIMEANKNNALIIFLCKFYELSLGRIANKHITVSKAFAEDIKKRLNVAQVDILYDLAVEGKFKELTEPERAEFLKRIGFENMVEGVMMKKDRPLLLITSTSYTPDEDIGLLLEALKLLGKKDDLKIVMVVTGTGPLKKQFLARFESFNGEQEDIKIVPKWLEI